MTATTEKLAKRWTCEEYRKILALENGTYERRCFAAETGQLSSSVLTGLKFDVSEIHG